LAEEPSRVLRHPVLWIVPVATWVDVSHPQNLLKQEDVDMDNTYQRVADADEVDDAIIVRIWQMDGKLVGEADHPEMEEASTGRIIVAALGNPVDVSVALGDAQRLKSALPFDKICVQIDDETLWEKAWGELLPIKPSALTTKPFR
jgi:hypothetical protein